MSVIGVYHEFNMAKEDRLLGLDPHPLYTATFKHSRSLGALIQARTTKIMSFKVHSGKNSGDSKLMGTSFLAKVCWHVI